MPKAELIDLNKFSNTFDISLLNDNWIPPAPQRELIDSLHRLLSATNYRLERSKTMNEGALNGWDFTINNIFYNYDTGYYRIYRDLRGLDTAINKFIKKSNKMINKFNNMESNIITKEYVKWIIKWPSPNTQTMITNTFPNVLESPTYEIGSCLWYSQIRKIPFYKNNEMYYKLGIFVGPKRINQIDDIIALNAKLKFICTIKYKEINIDKHKNPRYVDVETQNDDQYNIETIKLENNDQYNIDDTSIEIQHNEITFDVETNFIKLHDDGVKTMLWGKFIPELQEVIDEKTGNIPHYNIDIEIKYQILNQCMTYRQPTQQLAQRN